MFSKEERPPTVIARESFGKLRACPEQSVGINSTTEAIPFLEAMLLGLSYVI